MTRTRYYTAMSLDGYLADADGSLDWLLTLPDGGTEGGFASFLDGIGAMAMGATTYEWVLDHEPLLEQPERWQQWYGDRPTWVFTHRDLPRIPGADIRFVAGDVRPVHREMARVAGERDVWLMGGGPLAAAFADAGLLDELQLSVAPALLAGGAPLLPRRLEGRLRLTDARVAGVFAELRYEVDPPPA
jgi:dihydrofolate reductase